MKQQAKSELEVDVKPPAAPGKRPGGSSRPRWHTWRKPGRRGRRAPEVEVDGRVLLSDRSVAERYDVSVRTLERWDRTPGLGFPPPIWLRDRRYRSIAALDEWDADNIRKAILDRTSESRRNTRQAVAERLASGR